LAFVLGSTRLEDELSKAQYYGQANKKYANHDPENYLHRLPLK
jgi:hypothetical protein